MDENKELPILDCSEMFEYISGKTNIDVKIVEKILDCEMEYMMQLGLIDYN